MGTGVQNLESFECSFGGNLNWEAPEKLSIVQLASLCKLDRRTVSEKLIAAGIDYETGHKGSKIYVVAKALPALYSKVVKDELQILKETETEKLLLLRAKREKAQYELAQKLGEVVAVQEVADQVGKEYEIIRARFRALPNRLALQLSLLMEAEPVFDVLTKEIDDALSELQADAEAQLTADKINERILNGGETADLPETELSEQPSDSVT